MLDVEGTARDIVAQAGTLLRQRWGQGHTVHYKSEVDLVTDTDREVEAFVAEHLRRAFPDHLIVGEEASNGHALPALSAERYVWYLDPLDGTTNFAHAYPHFAVSVGLARGSELLFGIVYDPLRNEMFMAHRDRGATLNGSPIHTSTVADLGRALLATGFPYDRREHLDFYLGFLSDFLRGAQGVRRNGSAALDLCYVACGRLDGFWEWKLRPWDTAAGVLIVREAGGVVTDFRGEGFDLCGEQTLAANAGVHAAMVRVLSDCLNRAAGTQR